MSRQLLIMRHAKSAWDTDASSDFDRPLAKRGERDAPRMGALIKEQGLVPDHLISSPAERAKQTIVSVCKAMGLKKKSINWDSRIYGAGTETLLDVLSEVPQTAQTVMVVGHNPGLEYLFAHLAGDLGHDDFNAGMVKTATVVHLGMPDDWRDLPEGCAKVIAVMNPRDIS